MNESTQVTAREVYETLLEAIREMGWSFEEKENMQIRFSVQGNDIPMNFSMAIHEKKRDRGTVFGLTACL